MVFITDHCYFTLVQNFYSFISRVFYEDNSSSQIIANHTFVMKKEELQRIMRTYPQC